MPALPTRLFPLGPSVVLLVLAVPPLLRLLPPHLLHLAVVRPTIMLWH